MISLLSWVKPREVSIKKDNPFSLSLNSPPLMINPQVVVSNRVVSNIRGPWGPLLIDKNLQY